MGRSLASLVAALALGALTLLAVPTTAAPPVGVPQMSVPPPPAPPPDQLELPHTLAWNGILNLIKNWDGSDQGAMQILLALQQHYQAWYVGSSDPIVNNYGAYWASQLPFWQQNLQAFKDWLRTRQQKMLRNGEMPGMWAWDNTGVQVTMHDDSAQDNMLNTGLNLGLWGGHTLGAYAPPSTAAQLENELTGGGSPRTQPRFRVHISHVSLGNGIVRGYVQIIDRKLGVTVSTWYVDYPAGDGQAAVEVGKSFARKIESEIKRYLSKEKVDRATEPVKKVR